MQWNQPLSPGQKHFKNTFKKAVLTVFIVIYLKVNGDKRNRNVDVRLCAPVHQPAYWVRSEERHFKNSEKSQFDWWQSTCSRSWHPFFGHPLKYGMVGCQLLAEHMYAQWRAVLWNCFFPNWDNNWKKGIQSLSKNVCLAIRKLHRPVGSGRINYGSWWNQLCI